MPQNEETNYMKYRGKCKEFCEELIKQDSSLTLVRGYYMEYFWGESYKQPHWWCVKPDGTIVDPTKLQFPSAGLSDYVPFDGMLECSNCGKEIAEEDADIEGNYAFCSYNCHGRFVGVF